MSENFENLFESSEYSKALKLGQLIQADVIDITNDHAILSAGLKSESLVSINQFKDQSGDVEIKVGDKVEVVIEEIEDGEGRTKLSRQKAKNEKTWQKLIDAMNNDEIVNGFIQTRVKGGFTVLVDQINAFLPGSLVDVRPVRDTQYLEGSMSEFKVVKAEKHPDADKLKVCQVETKNGNFQVVCGAPNAREGMLGIFAPENSFIPGTKLKLKTVKIHFH